MNEVNYNILVTGAAGFIGAALSIKLLENGVLCSPGTAFGSAGEGHLRFAYTISREDISEGMDRVEKILTELRGNL